MDAALPCRLCWNLGFNAIVILSEAKDHTRGDVA